MLKTTEPIKLSFGLSGFLDVLFLLSSGHFCPKFSEVGFLENRGFRTNGRESFFVLTIYNDRATNSLQNEMSSSSL